MSMMRALADRGDRRRLWLFYANPDWAGVTFREEIETLVNRLNLTVVHILENAPADFPGETGILKVSLLRKHLRDEGLSDFRCFLCGPVHLTDAAEDGLRAMGVPSSHIRTELFELA